jgi:hypothetical protein
LVFTVYRLGWSFCPFVELACCRREFAHSQRVGPALWALVGYVGLRGSSVVLIGAGAHHLFLAPECVAPPCIAAQSRSTDQEAGCAAPAHRTGRKGASLSTFATLRRAEAPPRARGPAESHAGCSSLLAKQVSSLNSLRKCPPPPPRILNFGQGSVVDTRGVF